MMFFKISLFVSGFVSFVYGIYLLKMGNFVGGCIFMGLGMVLEWSIEIAPTPNKKKFKLKKKHIEEIENEVSKDALIRELTFLENEKTEELVGFVNDLSFEDALIVVKSIETKYPNLLIGRGIEL